MSVGKRPFVVAARRALTAEITEFELRPADGSPITAADAGAHIQVDTPSGHTRSYSLTGDLAGASSHRIAVRRSADGEGASRSMADQVAVGDELLVSEPRNTFGLEGASGYLLIAAGIGITPIRAMAHELVRRGERNVEIVYLARSESHTAYLEEIRELAPGVTVTVHLRDEAQRPLDLWTVLAEPGDRRIYCCGPKRLEEEVRALTMHWRPSRVHFERFAGISAFGLPSLPFAVTWQPTGAQIPVAPETSMLSALRGASIELDSSCESGTCGTCILRLVSGRADHRDVVLSEEQREIAVMPCVSRALDDELVVGPQ